MDDEPIQSLVAAARSGSKPALEEVVRFAQPYIYNLALRMLQRPIEAEDATQEILIRLITSLSQYRGESAFTTWMYRVAHNSLLSLLAREQARSPLSFDALGERLEWSLAQGSAEDVVEQAELVEEVRRSCTLGMLMCLDAEDRMALALGELLDLSSEDAAFVMGVSSAAYRKRLSRARQALVRFISQRCGIVNPASPCRCHRHVRNKIAAGQIDPEHLVYAATPHTTASAQEAARAAQPDFDALRRSLALLRAHPEYASRRDLRAMLDEMLNPGDLDG
jgi:RNA polymerase sigma factor (sigma-70 family)